MPYYDFNRPVVTSGSVNTLVTHFRILTVAAQNPFRLTGLYGVGRNAVAGGGEVRFTQVTATTIASGGTPIAAPNGINKRAPYSPAASTTMFTDASTITAGTGTLAVHLSLGWAQPGGMGGWVANDMIEAAIRLEAGGTFPGNGEIGSTAPTATMALTITGEFSEL